MKKPDIKFPVLILFLLLMSTAMLLMLYSARIYDSVVKNGSRRNNAFVAGIYITEKIRRCGQAENIDTTDTELILHLPDDTDTVISFKDGILYELNRPKNKDIDPSSGQALFALAEIQIERHGNLLYLSVTDEAGNTAEERIRICQPPAAYRSGGLKEPGWLP